MQLMSKCSNIKVISDTYGIRLACLPDDFVRDRRGLAFFVDAAAPAPGSGGQPTRPWLPDRSLYRQFPGDFCWAGSCLSDERPD